MDKIKLASEALGSLSLAALQLASGGDEQVILATTFIQPYWNATLDTWSHLLKEKYLSLRERKRLNETIVTARDSMNHHIKSGTVLNNEALKSGITEDIVDAIEQILKDATSDAESKKAKYYGKFLGKVPFYDGIDVNIMIYLDRILRNLSYNHLVVLKWIHNVGNISAETLRIQLSEDREAIMFFQNIKELRDNGLLTNFGPISVSHLVGNVTIGSMGKDLYNLLDLEEITDSELEPYNKYKEQICYKEP